MKFKVARAALHHWEEPLISGRRGSGTIFFSGCSLRCVYCQNYQISHQGKGIFINDEELIKLMLYLQDKGAHNINLVTPSHYAYDLARVLDKVKGRELIIPIVYNSGGYDKIDALERLTGLVDIYLPDYKYYDNLTGARYSKILDYADITKVALTEMRRQQPKDIISKGIMLKGVIIRHLVLPGHIENTINILRQLEEMDNTLYISLMAQYFPTAKASMYPELNRRVTLEEYNETVNFFLNSSLKNGFSQDPSSAIEDYVPDFNLDELKAILKL